MQKCNRTFIPKHHNRYHGEGGGRAPRSWMVDPRQIPSHPAKRCNIQNTCQRAGWLADPPAGGRAGERAAWASLSVVATLPEAPQPLRATPSHTPRQSNHPTQCTATHTATSAHAQSNPQPRPVQSVIRRFSKGGPGKPWCAMFSRSPGKAGKSVQPSDAGIPGQPGEQET